MLRIIDLFKRLFVRVKSCFYVGATDILPEPLSREKEDFYLELLEDGDLTIGELSRKINLAFSTTTDLVDRMEKNKLVERTRDTKDRRVVRIHLLPVGRKIIREVIDQRRVYLSQVLSDVPADKVDVLDDVLELLLEKMQWDRENN